MLNRNGLNIAAALFVEARTSGRRIREVPPDAQPRSLDSAYRIQDAVAHLLRDGCGWKVGLTSKSARDAFLADTPISGRLFADHVLWSPCTIPAARYPMRGIEAEVVCLVGATPRADGPLSLDEVADVIDCVIPAIEICDSRFVDPDAADLPAIVADNASGGALVLGERFIAPSRTLDRVDVTLRATAQPDVRGNSDAVLGHPYRAVQWLHEHLLSRGIHLREGDLIATGSMTGFAIAAPGATVAADFGPLGEVHIQFASSSGENETVA